MDIAKKTAAALKWSALTEIIAKIMTPIINMILARILAPEAFGILATVTMVITFAEVFVESGFSKYLIQHNFESKRQEHEHMSVALWANLIFAFVLWGALILFQDPIAAVAGNEGLGLPIAVAGVMIPLYSIIGIQDCKIKKSLEFKGLFVIRVISAFMPLVVTVPLALIGLDYWSLIIGNIVGIAARSALLVFFGRFIPLFYFSWRDLKHMLRYGIWTLLDGIATWGTSWIDTLLISHYMNEYYMGLYKNSVSTVTQLFTIVTSSIVPVLFAALSRLQDDTAAFNGMFLKVQKTLCLFLLPLGVGLFFYRELATDILFGDKWAEAANIVGVIALTTALRTIFVSFYGEAYRAKGKFYLPLVLQILDIALLVPACIVSVRYGFWPLVYTRAFIKLDLILPEILFAYLVCGITPKMTGKAIAHPVLATAVMSAAILGLQAVSDSMLWSFISIGICVVVYFGTLALFRDERKNFFKPILKKIPGIKRKIH